MAHQSMYAKVAVSLRLLSFTTYRITHHLEIILPVCPQEFTHPERLVCHLCVVSVYTCVYSQYIYIYAACISSFAQVKWSNLCAEVRLQGDVLTSGHICHPCELHTLGSDHLGM